jgi:hypothetical protein
VEWVVGCIVKGLRGSKNPLVDVVKQAVVFVGCWDGAGARRWIGSWGGRWDDGGDGMMVEPMEGLSPCFGVGVTVGEVDEGRVAMGTGAGVA